MLIGRIQIIKITYFFVLHPKDFLSNSRFLLLSKKAFEFDEIDKEALKNYKRPRKKNEYMTSYCLI
jgi:hypothetical protein